MSTRLTELLRAFDGNAPLAQALTIPSAWYFDQELYDLECRRIFGGTWQFVGRSELVREPGAFLTAEVAGEPILVVRDDKGTLRAFYNVCRHRAAQVLNAPSGKVSRLRCRYHGWTYDLTGRLRGTPEFEGVEAFHKEREGLVPMAVDTWGPFVFVHQGTPRETLAEFLAPLPEQIQDFGIETLQFVERREYDLQCNWKVFVDNYQDGGYHINTVHPKLAGVLDYANYRTANYANGSVQISPLEPSADPTMNKVRSGANAYYCWLFPNLMINLYQGVMDTNWVLPLGPDRCRTVFDFYFADAVSEQGRKFNAESIGVAHQVQLEDIAVCEETQRGLRSRSYDTGRFSVKREAGGYHFHQLLARALGSAT